MLSFRWFAIALWSMLMFALLGSVMCAAQTMPVFGPSRSASGKAASVRRHPVPLAPITPQSIYAPLVALDDPAQAELLLNNVAPMSVDVQYTIYSLKGEILAIDQVTLGPTEIRYISVADLLTKASQIHRRDLGGIVLNYQGRSMGVLAQITYLGGGERNSIDGIFFFAMDLPSTTQNAVWSMPAEARATLVLGNSSDAKLDVKLSVDSQKAEELTLAAHSTRLIAVDDDESRHGRNRAHSATVTYSGPMGALREAGFVIGEHGYAAPIRFYDREGAQQKDLFATDLPVTQAWATMTLFNTGSADLTARPQLFAIGGSDQEPIRLDSITLRPQERVSVVLTDSLRRLGADKVDSVSVRVASSGAPGDLIGSLVSVRGNEREVVAEVPLREPGMPGQSTGSYPLRLDGDYTDVVTITNASTEEKKFFAHIDMPTGDKYVFRPQSLKPGETARFDINEIRDTQKKDAFGHTLPLDLKVAKFAWTISAPWVTARMIGRNYVRSASKRVSASFSCGLCCPDVTQGPFPSPDPTGVMTVGDSMFGSVTREDNDCQGNITSFPDFLNPSFDVPNVCSFSQGEGTYQMTAVGAGLTHLSFDFTFANISFDGQDCFMSGPFHQTETVPNTVQVPDHLVVLSDKITTLNCSPNPSSQARQILYEIQDQSNTQLGTFINIRETVPSPTISSCTGSPVTTTSSCTSTFLSPPHIIGEFTDSLLPGCPNSPSNSPCGFTFPNQQWQWCPASGLPQSTGTVGPVNAQNTLINVNGNVIGFIPGTIIPK